MKLFFNGRNWELVDRKDEIENSRKIIAVYWNALHRTQKKNKIKE